MASTLVEARSSFEPSLGFCAWRGVRRLGLLRERRLLVEERGLAAGEEDGEEEEEEEEDGVEEKEELVGWPSPGAERAGDVENARRPRG